MFLISLIFAFICFVISTFISINWINDIAYCFGYFFAVYIVTFVSLVPGFSYVFSVCSLVFNKYIKSSFLVKDPDVTVLIPVYNSEDCILDTLNSIKNQIYDGSINVIVIDDGSTDNSLEIIKSFESDNDLEIIESSHLGKAFALNNGLDLVNTDYVISVDSDTFLHDLAIRNIMKKALTSNANVVATAGCLFAKNVKNNFVAKLQAWDYSLGIFGVKLIQGFYNSTLVTQGAFSVYKTSVLKEIGGWQDCVGEDIVLTWDLLSHGYRTNFAADAVGFTFVPESMHTLGKQRKRWARGMIEAFKRVNVFGSKNLNIKSKLLMFLNIFFPFIDLAFLFFLPLGLILLLFSNPLLIGFISLLVIPLGLFLCFLIETRRNKILENIDIKFDNRSILSFLFYVFLYPFFLTPYCLSGYFSELFNLKKKW